MVMSLTASDLLRRKVGVKRNREKEPVTEDIDESIKRLEREIARDDDEESESSSSSEDELPQTDDKTVINISSVKNERIEALAVDQLPPVRDKVSNPRSRPQKKQKAEIHDDGLTKAVKEVLSGYKPRSSERLPFYCRVCAKQYDNEEEFFAHKSDNFHKRAVQMERKASYCKLCRKQLTSPVQLREHLQSRPHKERLQAIQLRQTGRKRA